MKGKSDFVIGRRMSAGAAIAALDYRSGRGSWFDKFVSTAGRRVSRATEIVQITSSKRIRTFSEISDCNGAAVPVISHWSAKRIETQISLPIWELHPSILALITMLPRKDPVTHAGGTKHQRSTQF